MAVDRSDMQTQCRPANTVYCRLIFSQYQCCIFTTALAAVPPVSDLAAFWLILLPIASGWPEDSKNDLFHLRTYRDLLCKDVWLDAQMRASCDLDCNNDLASACLCN